MAISAKAWRNFIDVGEASVSGRNIRSVTISITNSSCTRALAAGTSCHLDIAVQLHPVNPRGTAGAFSVRLLAASITDAGGRQLDGNHDGLGGDDYIAVKPLISKGAAKA